MRRRPSKMSRLRMKTTGDYMHSWLGLSDEEISRPYDARAVRWSDPRGVHDEDEEPPITYSAGEVTLEVECP